MKNFIKKIYMIIYMQNIIKLDENTFFDISKLISATYDDNEATICRSVGGMIGTHCTTVNKNDKPEEYKAAKSKIDMFNQLYEKQQKLEENRYNYKMNKYTKTKWFTFYNS